MIRSNFVVKVKHQPQSREAARKWAVAELLRVVETMENANVLYSPTTLPQMLPEHFLKLCLSADELVDTLGLPEEVTNA